MAFSCLDRAANVPFWDVFYTRTRRAAVELGGDTHLECRAKASDQLTVALAIQNFAVLGFLCGLSAQG